MDNRHTKNLDKEQENRHHHHSVLWVSLWKETKAKEKGGRHRYRGRPCHLLAVGQRVKRSKHGLARNQLWERQFCPADHPFRCFDKYTTHHNQELEQVLPPSEFPRPSVVNLSPNFSPWQPLFAISRMSHKYNHTVWCLCFWLLPPAFEIHLEWA